MFVRFMASQLAKPNGAFGRWLMGPRLNRLNRAMNQLALEALEPVSGTRILEIGFGGGGLMEMLLERGAKVSGCDFSPAVVRHVRAKLRKSVQRGKADVHCADVSAMPFPDGSFDQVCTVNTIYFWRDPDAAMEEIVRVLRPAGRVLICFNPAEELRQWPGHRHGFRLYDLDDVEALLGKHGFSGFSILEADDPQQGRFISIAALNAGAHSEADFRSPASDS
jgi:SAM-dependent methyltransferase